MRGGFKKTNRKQYRKVNETKSWFSEKFNKIYKLLARLTKEKREDTNYLHQE